MPDSSTNTGETDTSTDTQALAEQVADELASGTVVADKVVISKQHAVAIMAGGATLAGVLGLAGRATAQDSGGKFGTESEPLDADLGNYGYTDTADGATFTIEGNTFEVNE